VCVCVYDLLIFYITLLAPPFTVLCIFCQVHPTATMSELDEINAMEPVVAPFFIVLSWK